MTGLAEVLARRFLTTDAARPHKVARRYEQGGRTARENIADLVDEGSFVEYGRFAHAAQEQRRDLHELVTETPADGIIGGTATVGGLPCAVLSYDYLVLAGTQGMRGHRKSDRLLDVVRRLRLPVVFFTEGGGGRPGDTDYPVSSALDVASFALWAELSGLVPRIAVVAGRCFAGNAVIAGTADVVIATQNSNLGMAGPAMIAGGGLGQVAPEDIGPISDQTRNGVVDIAVADEADAVETVRHLLPMLAGINSEGAAAEQSWLRDALPSNEREAFDVRPIIETIMDADSVLWLRERYAPEVVTALARVDGRPVGIIANQSTATGGALTTEATDSCARMLEMCEAIGLPVISLVDTPGFMVGPEAERTGLVRAAGRLMVAGAKLSTPLIGVILRRGYGLGAQAMLGGSTLRPVLTVAWPDAHMGPMGLEGAVRLAMAKELATLSDGEREVAVRDRTMVLREQAKALNAARLLEIDDVIDPAETRSIIMATLAVSGGR